MLKFILNILALYSIYYFLINKNIETLDYIQKRSYDMIEGAYKMGCLNNKGIYCDVQAKQYKDEIKRAMESSIH